MSNEQLPHTPTTSTPRLTKAQRRTLRRREQRARETAAAERAKDAAQPQARDGRRSTVPATQDDSKNDRKEPQFPQLSGAARRALSRTTVSSTEIKAIRVAQSSIEAERKRKSAARDAELRRRTLNRRLPKR